MIGFGFVAAPTLIMSFGDFHIVYDGVRYVANWIEGNNNNGQLAGLLLTPFKNHRDCQSTGEELCHTETGHETTPIWRFSL